MTATQRAELRAAHCAAWPLVLMRAPALILVSFVLTLAGPLWLLLLAPLVLGVPHIVGDVRCLLLPRLAGTKGTSLAGILAPLAAMTLLRAAAVLGFGSWPRAELACGVAAVLAGVRSAAVGTRARTLAGAGIVAAGVLACTQVPATMLILAHAHNVIAFGWYIAWAKDHGESRLALACYLVAAAAIFGGVTRFDLGASTGGLAAREVAVQLAPGMSDVWTGRIVLSFAFAQSVHYAVWVWLIPQARTSTLRLDLGPRGVWFFAACAGLVPALALFDPAGVRNSYLAIVAFHGWLELAVLASLWRSSGT